MPALGEEFRSAREARGLTLSDVADQIHIRSVYLGAIENEEWSAIGAPVYVRGFMRTYARFLGLDGEDAVARFNQAVPQDERPAAAAVPLEERRPSRGPSVWAVIGTLVAVALVGFVGWQYWQYNKGTQGTSVAVSTAPPQPAAAVGGSQAAVANVALRHPAPRTAAPAAGRHQVAIRLVQRSWIRVTVDGTTKLEGIYPAGTAWTFGGNLAEVRAGNAGGVSVAAGGKPATVMGKDGDVVEQRYTL